MLYQMPELRIDYIIYNNLFVRRRIHKLNLLPNLEKEQIEKLRTCISQWNPKSEKKVAAKEALVLSIDSRTLGGRGIRI